MLKDIFESMDVDGDGSVDVAEYRTSTDNKTMLKLYQLMDKRGDGNGSLSLDEWLTTMSLVGRSMTDAAFERDLASMLRPSNEVIASIAPERLAKLKSLFIQVGMPQLQHHQPVPAYIRAALVLAGSNSVHAAESVHAAARAQMDLDGDGTVDLAEYKASTSNPTMLKLFDYMDNSVREMGGGRAVATPHLLVSHRRAPAL